MMNCEEFKQAHPDKKDCLCYALQTPVEKNKQFSIILPKGNTERFLRIKIDKGLLLEIDNETKKCDYGFIRCLNSDYYFVELKGEDIEKAVAQITTTIKHFQQKYGVNQNNTYAYIASSGVPKQNLKFQKLQENFLKQKLGKELKKQTNHYQHTL
jgi:hypothetical protein